MFHGPIDIFSEVCSRLQNIPVFLPFAYFQERVGGFVLFEFKKPTNSSKALYLGVGIF